jgi:hypothetical protein
MSTRRIACIESELRQCERELCGFLGDARGGGGRWLGVGEDGPQETALTWVHVEHFYQLMTKWISKSGYRLSPDPDYLEEVTLPINKNEVAIVLNRIKFSSVDNSTICIEYRNMQRAKCLMYIQQYIQPGTDAVIRTGVTAADGPPPTTWKDAPKIYDLKYVLDEILSDTSMANRLFSAFYTL